MLLKIMWHILPHVYRICSNFQDTRSDRRESKKTEEVLQFIKSKSKKFEKCSCSAETCSICLVDFEGDGP